MGLKEKRKPHKEKNKRKRGKKYKYDPEKENNHTSLTKHNPFEAFSQKKFQKKNNTFSQLISEYQSKNVVNSFQDKRIAENSNLSYDEKMKLRFKAQQLLKKTKKSKFAFDNDNSDSNSENDIKLTHKGKEINVNDISDNNSDMSDNNNDDDYYEKMNEYIENMDSNKKMTKQEKFKAIIQKSKKLKEEKHRIKENNLNKIDYLNDNFEELNSMLKKRKRTFNRLN